MLSRAAGDRQDPLIDSRSVTSERWAERLNTRCAMARFQKLRDVIFAPPAQATTFDGAIGEWLAQARELAADGLTLAELSQLLFSFIAVCVSLARTLSNSGTDKKAIVLGAVERLIDLVVPLALARFGLGWTSPLVLRVLKPLLLRLADGAIEAFYRQLDPAKE